jgi:putative DNA-invertase from lambdoid prophage Rac
MTADFVHSGSIGDSQRRKGGRLTGIEHAKQHGDRANLGRKPSYTRKQYDHARALLAQEAVGIARVAKETGLTRQTVYRIKGDPASAEAALAARGM